MFRLDPLLLERHPDKYIELIRMERHYRYKPGFWHHFARGLRDSGVQAPVGKLFQQLRVHDPEWWSQVTAAKNGDGDSAMTPEDMAAIQELLAAHMKPATQERELNA